MIEKVCPECGITFQTDNYRKKSCSRKCHNYGKWLRWHERHPNFTWKKERKCKVCGAAFMPNQKHQVYCSSQCRDKGVGATFKANNPEYWKQWRDKNKFLRSRKKMNVLRLPYNKNLCRFCGDPLGRTANRFFHKDCHTYVTDMELGIEGASVLSY